MKLLGYDLNISPPSLKLRRVQREVDVRGLPRDRVSVEEPEGLGAYINQALDFYRGIEPRVPSEITEVIERLAKYNPDFSQIVSKIILLGNTGHKPEFDGKSSEIKRAQARMEEVAPQLYPGAGLDGLVNQMLRQIAIHGALSVEWVPNKSLTGLEKSVLVPVKKIRFKYSSKADSYYPCQLLQDGSLRELNLRTYNYFPLMLEDDSPYALSPFLGALEPVLTQIYMTKNIKFIIKKLGLLGFIKVLAQIPEQEPGENKDAYYARLTANLSKIAKSVQENFYDGVGVAYDDLTIEHSNIAADARGGKEYFELNEQQVASGADFDPAMMGRTYSTTETYAGVVYATLTKKLDNIRNLVKRALEFCWRLDYLMQGIDVEASINFNENAALDPEKEANAEKIRTETVIAKMDAGLIDEEEAKRQVGE